MSSFLNCSFERLERKDVFKILMLAILFSITMTSCEFSTQNDKTKMAPKNYNLFKGTEAWSFAQKAREGDLEACRIILQSNPNIVNIEDSVYGNTILMLSIFHRDYNLFKTIMQFSPQINCYNKWQASPIYEASRYDDSEVRFVKDLIEAGADINDKIYNESHTKIMSTPLQEAAGHAPTEIVAFLINNGADINFRNDFGGTALGEAVACDRYKNAILLIQNGADINAPIFNSVDKKGNLTIPNNILMALRKDTPDFPSKKFFQKRELIKILKAKGLDYDAEPVPDYIMKRIKSKYPLTWKLYVKYY